MKKLALIALPFVLAACSESEPEPAPTPTPTVAAPRLLVGADLDLSTLGAKIVGPQGPEVETTLSAGGRQLGTMVSYVACPEEVTECVPGQLPPDPVYTYVHQVTLSDADMDSPDAQPSEGPEVVEAPPTLFRTTQRAYGFNQSIGYSKAQAQAALGDPDAISISIDNGSLIWRVVSGSGWQPGSTITFWWQSTLPPAGPAEAYLLEIDGDQASATGPFPSEPENPADGPAGN